ncbi:MAG: flippase-like domain-containing protein, partial [Candidatus Omnitrophica bacterium]|nr:flippase-like domain-containing protein [Candidatus Omnitrophota bacterium]MBD3268650.1 flippase-like domain-containing protein [Candidatus Omnitrophota bacterium]
MSKKYFFVFRLLVSCALLFALFHLVPYTKILDIYQNSIKFYLVLSFFVFLFAHVISIYRWKIILLHFGKKVSFFDLGGSFLSGTFFNLFFPSCIAGDVFRGVSISVRDGESSKVISSVLMDRFCGAVGMAMFAVLAFLAGGNILMREEVIIPLVIFCAAVIIGALIVFSKTFLSWILILAGKNNFIRKKLVTFHDELSLFRRRPATLAKGVFLSFFIQICAVISFYLAALAFGYRVNLFYFLILVPIIIAI